MTIYPDIDLHNGFILAEKLRLFIKESEELNKYKLTQLSVIKIRSIKTITI